MPHRVRRMSDRRDAQNVEEYKSPPNNLEAEQALLGALLVNNDALHKEFLPDANGLRYVRHPKIRPDAKNPS